MEDSMSEFIHVSEIFRFHVFNDAVMQERLPKKVYRGPVDKLEMIVDKDMWPMPSYGDLIFEAYKEEIDEESVENRAFFLPSCV